MMTKRNFEPADWLRSNWFWPVAFVLIGIAWAQSRFVAASVPEHWEYAVVFDVLVSLPLLFLLCFRNQLSRKQLVLRLVALQCLGIWFAVKIVPVEDQILLPRLAWLRYAGLAVLTALELALAAAILKIVFSRDTSQQDLEGLGMPPLVAKLALLEAKFWRWIWGLFKR